MERMLVTQALNELKTLDSRINRAINHAEFVASAKTSEKKVTAYTTKEDFIAKATSDFQSINALIKRRKAIKSAIVLSNATTVVTIAGVEMTVAEAIERKSSIEYECALYRKIDSNYTSAITSVAKNNLLMEDKIDALVTTAYGKDAKTTIKPEDYASIAEPYKAANEYTLVDPLGAKDLADKMKNEIESFNAEVDSVLQVSNCTTFIELAD